MELWNDMKKRLLFPYHFLRMDNDDALNWYEQWLPCFHAHRPQGPLWYDHSGNLNGQLTLNRMHHITRFLGWFILVACSSLLVAAKPESDTFVNPPPRRPRKGRKDGAAAAAERIRPTPPPPPPPPRCRDAAAAPINETLAVLAEEVRRDGRGMLLLVPSEELEELRCLRT